MNHPAPQAPTRPAGARDPGRVTLAARVRCLAVRVAEIIRAAHSASVPF
jgi:hypothetical protein